MAYLIDVDDWFLETNQRGHWLAFNASRNNAQRLVDAVSRTRLGVRTWDESFRPARNGVTYDWYVLLKFRGDRNECLLVLDDLLRTRDAAAARGDPPAPRSFWNRVIGLLPWVHESETSSEAESSAPRPAVGDNLNVRPVYKLVVNLDTGSWPSEGVLRELGYKVGRSGLGSVTRRHILRNALSVELVAATTDSESYVREWGSPESEQRAEKIERCLVGFANNARRRRADMSEAIADWEDDLRWFRECRGR